jgi:hypothetical protein
MTKDSSTAPGPSEWSVVTRAEVVAHVEGAFVEGPVTPGDLVEAAVRSGARPAVIEVLLGLPERRFAEPRELEVALADVPVDARPSEGGPS